MENIAHLESSITKLELDETLNGLNGLCELSLYLLDFDQYAASAESPPSEDERRAHKIVSMAKEEMREGNRIGSYKKRLRIDVRRTRRGDPYSAPSQPRSVERAMPTLISLLQRTWACSFDGPLYHSHLSSIIQVGHLKTLDLRASDWFLELGTISLACENLVQRTWKDLILDFSILANLTGLQDLKVGRLLPAEARSLAVGITPLKLTHLSVSASIWAQPADPRSYIAGGAGDASPIFDFLKKLVHYQRDDLGLELVGLPSTLETLVVCDRYRLRHLEDMHESLRHVCQPCTSLRQLEVTLPCKQSIAGFLAQFGSVPRTAYQGTTPLKISILKNEHQTRIHGEPDNGTTSLNLPLPEAIWYWTYIEKPNDILNGYVPLVPGPTTTIMAAIKRSERLSRKGPRTLRLERVAAASNESQDDATNGELRLSRYGRGDFRPTRQLKKMIRRGRVRTFIFKDEDGLETLAKELPAGAERRNSEWDCLGA
ncbi:hypothetical protein N7G274_002587 [Stereocaulon virgatum]|uniref:F-box domain-containing protein n=1 Tax=Stereocaulon virgatum TaxID=373712 RepID=A0ABR4AG70_9LECA